MPKIGIILLISFLILSCQEQTPESKSTMGNYHADEAMAYEVDFEIEPPQTAEPTYPSDFSLDKGSKIIKTGQMKFEVNQLEMAKNSIDSILHKCKGYYENEQYNSHGNRISYTLQLRIPNTKFDSLVTVLELGLGELKSKNVTAIDLTEEYVDVNIRLENNLAYLNQYKEILRKAKSVKEILEVQEKIRNIEEEIESKMGRLKFIDDKVNYSTLSLEITELLTSKISNKPNFGRRIANAFTNGIQGFLSFVIGLVNLWPLLILVVLVFMGRKPIINKIRRRNTPPDNKP